MSMSRAERARRIQQAAAGEGSAIHDALAQPETPPEPEPTPPTPKPAKKQPAPKAKKPKAKTTPIKEATVRFTIDLDESMHRRLKLLALDNKVRAAEVVRAALDGHTDKELANLISNRKEARQQAS